MEAQLPRRVLRGREFILRVRCDVIQSGTVDANEVLDSLAADRALLQALAAADAGCVVVARLVHAVLLVLVAYHARVLSALLLHSRRAVAGARVGIGGANLEYRLVPQQVPRAFGAFLREPLPGSK